jgi:hypothetical protein
MEHINAELYEALEQLVDYLHGNPSLYEGDDNHVLRKLIYQATEVLEQARMTHSFMNLSVSR